MLQTRKRKKKKKRKRKISTGDPGAPASSNPVSTFLLLDLFRLMTRPCDDHHQMTTLKSVSFSVSFAFVWALDARTRHPAPAPFKSRSTRPLSRAHIANTTRCCRAVTIISLGRQARRPST